MAEVEPSSVEALCTETETAATSATPSTRGAKGAQRGGKAGRGGARVERASPLSARERVLEYMRTLKRCVPPCFNAIAWSVDQVATYIAKTDAAEFAHRLRDEVTFCLFNLVRIDSLKDLFSFKVFFFKDKELINAFLKFVEVNSGLSQENNGRLKF